MTGALKVRTSTAPDVWTVIGGGSFATEEETIAGVVNDKAVTPAGLAAYGAARDVMWVGPEAPTDPMIEMWWDSNEPSDFGLDVSSALSAGGYNVVASPETNVTTGTDVAIVFGGTASNPHSVAGSSLPVIGGGYDNEILNSIAGTIAGGAHHLIDAAAGHGSVGGGSTQIVHSAYGTIGGGLQNTAHTGLYATIGGGRLNETGVLNDDTRTDATVAGGYLNKATGIHSTVAGGQLNTASGTDSNVAGGRSNTASGLNATVAGGVANTAGGQNATIVGGTASSASGDYSVVGGGGCAASAAHTVAFGDSNTASGLGSVALGRRAIAALDGKLTFANQQFAAVGDAQTSVIVAKVRTTTATPIGLGLVGIGGSGPIALPDNTTWLFRVSLVARRTDADNESAGYTCQGVIDRNTGAASTALVGTAPVTVVAEDTAAWDAAVTADTTNGALKITVTGEASKTIYWVARIELTEVTG